MTAILDARAVERNILDEILQRQSPLVPVDAPPGAGKTYLIENIVGLAVAHFGLRVAVAAPRRNQAADFTHRMRAAFPAVTPQLLVGSKDDARSQLTAIGVRVVRDPNDLYHGAGLVVSTVDKLGASFEKLADEGFDLVVFDEAYQTHVAKALPVLALARRIVLVGDPGQLEPFTEFDTVRFDAADDHVHHPLPKFLLAKNPGIVPLRLNVTRRLPADTVRFVQRSFYPQMPFAATASPQERRITFDAAGMGDAIDALLDKLAAGNSLVMLMLPAVDRDLTVDEELSATAVTIAERFVQRQGRWDGAILDSSHFMYVDAHRTSGSDAHLRFLASPQVHATKVGTPEVVQGLEAPIVIARHPLSGLKEISSFDLMPGRLCVMVTRHKLGCVLLGRADFPETMRRYEHDCGARLAGLADDVWRGFIANRELYDLLHEENRIVYA